MHERETWLVRVAVAAVAVHALVGSVHGAAHQALGVTLSNAQLVFVIGVITLAPIVAGAMLWRTASPVGARLLAASMAASLLFGAYYHFVAVTPDHVAHLPAGPHGWVVAFQLSAGVLLVVEAIGALLGVLLVAVAGKRSKS